VGRFRVVLSSIAVSIACITAVLAAVVLVTGGLGTSIAGVRVSAHHPERAAALAATSFLVAIVLVGYRSAVGIANGYLVGVSRVLRPERRVLASVMQVSDRHRVAILGVVLVSLAALAMTVARNKPFWHDEIFTIMVSGLPFATMYRAAADGIDLAPPLNTALTRVVHLAGGIGPVTTRLTPMAGFFAAACFLFLIVRRRAGTLPALTAALLPAALQSWPFAYEARGYALSMACFAAALYGWFEAAAGRRVGVNLAILTVSLAAGLWTHYYFVLAFMPIVIGEIVRQAAQRRLDVRPWIAMLCAGLMALPLWPLVRAASAQRTTFWARPDAGSPLLTRIQALYRYWFETPEHQLIEIVANVVVTLVVIELAYRVVWRDWPRRLPSHEVAALGICFLLPVAGLLLGDYLGVFTERYLIFTTVGVVLALVLGLWWLAPPSGLAEIAAVAGVIAATVHLGSRIVTDPERPLNPIQSRPLLADWLSRSSDPIVITGSVHYLEIWYYIPQVSQARLLYLADPEGEMRANGADTVTRGYSALARWTPLPVIPLDEFVAAHPRFWTYRVGSSWIDQSLIDRRATLIEHGRDRNGESTLYEVTIDR